MNNRIFKLSVAFALFLAVSSTAYASTTISTDITTGGVLTVGSTTATSTFSNSINLLNGCFSVNGVCLSGSGSGTPRGASSTVQFNANGSFGGLSNFTFDGSTLTVPNLTVNGAATFNGTMSAAVIPLQDTAINLSTVIASSGQMVYETDTKYSKAGDGTNPLGAIFPINPWIGSIATGQMHYMAGNVGIGTSTPAFHLDISNTDGKDQILLEDSSSTSGLHKYGLRSAQGGFYVDSISNGGGIATTSISISPNGYVGIGTTSPISTLAVNGSAAVYANQAALSVYGGVGSGTSISGTGITLVGGVGSSQSHASASNGGSLILTGGTGGLSVVSGVSGTGGNVTINGGAAGVGLGGASNGSTGNVILANLQGNVGIGTPTPVALLEVASSTGTTTMTIGSATAAVGSCLKLFRTDGTAIYAYIAAGATQFTLSTTPCASVTGF